MTDSGLRRGAVALAMTAGTRPPASLGKPDGYPEQRAVLPPER